MSSFPIPPFHATNAKGQLGTVVGGTVTPGGPKWLISIEGDDGMLRLHAEAAVTAVEVTDAPETEPDAELEAATDE